jgi:hypothetical protein
MTILQYFNSVCYNSNHIYQHKNIIGKKSDWIFRKMLIMRTRKCMQIHIKHMLTNFDNFRKYEIPIGKICNAGQYFDWNLNFSERTAFIRGELAKFRLNKKF